MIGATIGESIQLGYMLGTLWSCFIVAKYHNWSAYYKDFTYKCVTPTCSSIVEVTPPTDIRTAATKVAYATSLCHLSLNSGLNSPFRRYPKKKAAGNTRRRRVPVVLAA